MGGSMSRGRGKGVKKGKGKGSEKETATDPPTTPGEWLLRMLMGMYSRFVDV